MKKQKKSSRQRKRERTSTREARERRARREKSQRRLNADKLTIADQERKKRKEENGLAGLIAKAFKKAEEAKLI